MTAFVKGLDLCESFFNEIAKPILSTNFPALRYAAGVIGYGSEGIGLDDEMSTDHVWGPRFQFFQVLSAGRFTEAIRKVIQSAELKQLVPEIGSVSQFTDSTTVFDDVKLYSKLEYLYRW